MTSQERAQKFHTDDITTQMQVVLLIGWKYAASNQKHYPDPVVTRISMEFLGVFLSRLFAGKPVVASPNVGCFLRQVPQVHYGLLFL